MFGLARRLADLGIMGINRRNAEFTLALNPRRYYPQVDDKLRTKELALAERLAMPERIAGLTANLGLVDRGLLKTGAYGILRFIIPLFPGAARDFAPVAMVLPGLQMRSSRIGWLDCGSEGQA